LNRLLAEPLRRKLAFLVSGVAGFVLYYSASLVLVRQAHVGPGVAACLGVLVAIVPTFLLQRHFAFRDRGPFWPALTRYCALQAFNAAATGLLAGLGQVVGLADALNFLLSGATVVVVSYLALNHLVFRHHAGR
jgi:putative flippase GtrA